MNLIYVLLILLAAQPRLSFAAGASCASDFVARVRQLYPLTAAQSVVGTVGVSDAELRELLERGVIEAKPAKLWPRLIDGQPDLRAFRKNKRLYDYNEDEAAAQLRRATLDAWARSVADVLNARFPPADFWTEAYVGFIRALAIDFDDFSEYSPKRVKIRRAAEVSKIAKKPGSRMPQLRTLTIMLGYPWLKDEDLAEEFWSGLEAKFANLPSAGGAVLGLGHKALNEISFSERAPPYFKRITLDDLVSIAPASPAGFDLLDVFTKAK